MTYLYLYKKATSIDILKDDILSKLSNVNLVVIKMVPNRGRDIAPLIIEFGKTLLKYDIIGHFHTKKSLHNDNLDDWFDKIINLMLGSIEDNGNQVDNIFKLLEDDGKIVYPEGENNIIQDASGWAGNYGQAKLILDKYTNISINDYPVVEFPEGAMFWANTKSISEFLSLPLRYNDFPAEPIPADGTIAHALERLLLIFANKHHGKYYRIHESDSISDFRQYEGAKDFSSSIVHDDIKVMSFYLPQFHPIPENDEWHGKGFTEWTKVKAANPLFVGHYQQHIPHEDIGYYLLDTPETFKQQAKLMHQSGVYGQIFYHYWFSGRMILEKPAQMILENKDIDMPFCFCWANENWTMRWDGNENEILLGQNYSKDDARKFIQYLIPFFEDKRYVYIDNKPVLYIYRSSSVPNMQEYLDVWKEECERASINAPYVIAVLTRGTTHPEEFNLDAGVERVLHDWTDGNVGEIKDTLEAYKSINGSVLSYDKVAEYYENQKDEKDFTYFRSIVPMWDNTARYAEEAYLLNDSTPQRFQQWFEQIIEYSQNTLPQDKRFIIVNAWNEWAEGAHLEPDTRYGYSYLNSIGRALSNISYSDGFHSKKPITSEANIFIEIPEYIKVQLESDRHLQHQFFHCLKHSTILENDVKIYTNLDLIANSIDCISIGEKREADFILLFRHIVLFDSATIQNMIETASSYPESIISSNQYGFDFDIHPITDSGTFDMGLAYYSIMSIIPNKHSIKNIRQLNDARCFAIFQSNVRINKQIKVTTIIRFHNNANFQELKNALFCLASMKNCIVIPLIAAQNLSLSNKDKLKKVLNEIPFKGKIKPIVKYFDTNNEQKDFRTIMLNESLKIVSTRYATFLDYDDLLMPNAYEILLHRLKLTKKIVSFARVYFTSYDSKSNLIIKRENRFEYGYSYDDFIDNNHAPVHSFMLDLNGFDISTIDYNEDQIYMEDYYLTLQLFTRDNADWESLQNNIYIGDYIHSLDRSHTLAISSEEERVKLYNNIQYIKDNKRISALQELKKRKDSDSKKTK